MRGKHSEAIQKLKSQFLREKRSYQKESDTKIHEMAQQASQVCGGNLKAKFAGNSLSLMPSVRYRLGVIVLHLHVITTSSFFVVLCDASLVKGESVVKKGLSSNHCY